MSDSLTDQARAAIEQVYPGLLYIIDNLGVDVTDPSVLRQEIVSTATELAPGITTDLPGTLIEDLASTGTGPAAQVDQARVDIINSVSPFGSNPIFLDAYAQTYGVQRGQGSNPNALINISGEAGYYIASGFQVSDGIYLYSTVESFTIPSDGALENVYVQSTTPGNYLIPANTITSVVSNIAPGITLTVNNPNPGVPGIEPENDNDFRARIIAAGMVTSQGCYAYIKNELQNVIGVIPRSISIPVFDSPFVENKKIFVVMVDGGDPLQVAGAIYNSTICLESMGQSYNWITQAENNGDKNVSIYTALDHGYRTGMTAIIADMPGQKTEITGSWEVTYVNPRRFLIASQLKSPYTGGAYLQNNPRNLTAQVKDGVDVYTVPFSRPLQVQVSIEIEWQVSSTNIVDANEVAAQIAPMIADYINAIPIGQPINTLDFENIFRTGILIFVPENQIIYFNYQIYINGEIAAPSGPHSTIISYDTQSYLITTVDAIKIIRGTNG